VSTLAASFPRTRTSRRTGFGNRKYPVRFSCSDTRASEANKTPERTMSRLEKFVKDATKRFGFDA